MRLEIDNVSKEYIKGIPVLNSISFSATEETICLMGIRGEGKSSLIRLILGLDRRFQGDICYDGESVRTLKQRELDALLIDDRLYLNRNKTVMQNVLYGLKLRKIENKEECAKNAMEKCGIAHLADKKTKELGFEERFFVALAKGLARFPRLIILDDVFINLEEEDGIALAKKTLKILDGFEGVKIFATESLNLGNSLAARKIIL